MQVTGEPVVLEDFGLTLLDLDTAAGYESIVTVTQSQLDPAQPYQFYEDGARVSSQPAGSKINQSASTNAWWTSASRTSRA